MLERFVERCRAAGYAIDHTILLAADFGAPAAAAPALDDQTARRFLQARGADRALHDRLVEIAADAGWCSSSPPAKPPAGPRWAVTSDRARGRGARAWPLTVVR